MMRFTCYQRQSSAYGRDPGRRRLGLTATLVREDGCEADVFSLIGPKKYDVPWRELEQQGWIATAECHEIRVGFPMRTISSITPWRDTREVSHCR
ncbi:hypothetical protein [Dictyobacter formicarum]|uniref:hypothetical protein n=1 Tax=Dictyobacter formicarum TaxID=2778368 RepID=UPI0019158BF1|nr:hypothetical protein [Dictyobacter formicarum]